MISSRTYTPFKIIRKLHWLAGCRQGVYRTAPADPADNQLACFVPKRTDCPQVVAVYRVITINTRAGRGRSGKMSSWRQRGGVKL